MFCPECGAPNEDDAIFCGNCGAVLKPEEMPVEAVPDVSPLEPERKGEIVGIYGIDAPGPDVSGVAPERKTEVEGIDDEIPPPPPMEAREPQRVVPPPPQAGPTTPTSGLAIAALLLGIGGLTILPLLGSIVAIILGYMARNEIRQRPHEISGDGLALTGVVLGWIGVGLAVLGLLLGIGVTVCGLCGFFSSTPYWQ